MKIESAIEVLSEILGSRDEVIAVISEPAVTIGAVLEECGFFRVDRASDAASR